MAGPSFRRDNNTAEDVDHYEKRDLSERDFVKYPMRYIKGRNDGSYLGISLISCTLLCRYDVTCKSFDYVQTDAQKGDCHLSSSRHEDLPASEFPSRADAVHYGKISLDSEQVTGINTLDWVAASFHVFPGAYIAGKNDIKPLQRLSVHGCAWQCLENAACASFDYNVETMACTLSTYSRTTAGSDFRRAADHRMLYYERKDAFANPPTALLTSPGDRLLEQAFFKDSFAYIAGHNIGTQIEGLTAATCALRCLATAACKSFDYNRPAGRCVLSDANRALAGADFKTDDDDNDHTYYERLSGVDLSSIVWTLQDYSPASLSFGAKRGGWVVEKGVRRKCITARLSNKLDKRQPVSPRFPVSSAKATSTTFSLCPFNVFSHFVSSPSPTLHFVPPPIPVAESYPGFYIKNKVDLGELSSLPIDACAWACYDNSKCNAFAYNAAKHTCQLSSNSINGLTGTNIGTDNGWVLHNRKHAIAAIAARPEDVNALETRLDGLATQQASSDLSLQKGVATAQMSVTTLRNYTDAQLVAVRAAIPTEAVATQAGEIATLKNADEGLTRQITEAGGLAQTNAQAITNLRTSTKTSIDAAFDSANASALALVADLRSQLLNEITSLALKAEGLNQTDVLNLVQLDLASTKTLVSALETKLEKELFRAKSDLTAAVDTLAANVAGNITEHAQASASRASAIEGRVSQAEAALATHATSDDLTKTQSDLEVKLTAVDSRETVAVLQKKADAQAAALVALRAEFKIMAQCVQDGLIFVDGACTSTPAPSFSDPDAAAASKHSTVAIAIGLVGLLLGVVALVVAVRARRSVGGAQFGARGTSAAFENPLYDSARAQTAKKVVADATDAEGVYDDPQAFDPAQDEGGYMDVHA